MRRLAGLSPYLLIPALGAIAPLIVIPAVSVRYGADGWASLAIALALGGAGAVVAELGWGVIGPQLVARESASRTVIFRESVVSRLMAVLIVAPMAGLASLLLVQDHAAAAVVLAVAVVAGALSPFWYFIGLGRPGTVLLVDTTPRVTSAIASAVIISLGGPLESYGALMLAAVVITFFLGARSAGVPANPDLALIRRAFAIIRGQGVVVLGRAISTVYTSLPAALLALVSPFSVATYSAIDRLMRMGLTILLGVPSRLQSWIGSADKQAAIQRSRKSMLYNFALGIMAGAAFVVLAPAVTQVLFVGTIQVTLGIALAGGALAAAICTSRGFGLALVAAGRSNQITFAIISAATVGLVGVLLLGWLMGTLGAIIALVAAEVVGIAVQWLILRRAWRSDAE